MTAFPNESPVEAEARRRLELAEEWLLATQVSTMIYSVAGDTSLVADLRHSGYLLEAWVPSERAFRYSTWQFRPDG